MSTLEERETRYVGQAMKRKEDPRMITGGSRYVDGISLPGMLYAAIVRSPEAHATITSIDASAARERPGVVAVLTGEDLADAFAGPMAATRMPWRRRWRGCIAVPTASYG
jgi:carbon-monoxide dehydrogenase large subunit